ncbi:type I-E CRISPR-associated protein Cse2/CasB [bacterium]|nr:type I-E CRISPR-associated protein Cse2/CasB [bacterium]
MILQEEKKSVQSEHVDEKFVRMLEGLNEKQDRAALAALRRGLGKAPGEAMEAYRYIAPFVSEKTTRQYEAALHTVGTLFGLYPSRSRAGDGWFDMNMGASLRDLKGKLTAESVDRRFVSLLNSHRDDLDDHLRSIVSLLKSKDITVNWLQLLRDIMRWEDDRRIVQRNWAKAFWQEEGLKTSI